MMEKISFISISVILSVCIFFTSGSSNTIRVPADQPTIKAGIVAASEGDTVLVADGTYSGNSNKNLDFMGKAITVMSENGPNRTIIDCGNSGRGFIFENSEDNTSIVEGFQIRNGSQRFQGGGGILCFYASPTIINCIISGNKVTGIMANGGGINCFFSNATISDCVVSDNSSSDDGGGIYCFMESPVISDCLISGNSTNQNGGGLYCEQCAPIVEGCTISNNNSDSSGGGCSCVHSPTLFRDCLIKGNQSNLNGGFLECRQSAVELFQCTINENTSLTRGGALYFDSSSPAVYNCVITNNAASENGGGIYSLSSSPLVMNCTITNNSSGEPGGGLYISDSWPGIRNTIIRENGDQGIYILSGTPFIDYSDVEGWWPGVGNIDEDPLFAVPEYHDYRLLWGSPVIDSGYPFFMDTDGTISDMGALPFDQSGKLSLYISPEDRQIAPGDSLAFRYTVCSTINKEIDFLLVVELWLPDGTPWRGNPLGAPLGLGMETSGNLTGEIAYVTSPGIKSGTYTIVASIGKHGEVIDTDQFECTITN